MEKPLTVQRSIWINAPRERVWRAVTESEQLQAWWGDLWDIADLRIGAPVRFGAEPNVLVATIETLNPPDEFKVRWPPNPRFPVTTMSTTFLLAEENGGTRVIVIEAGYEGLPDDIRQSRMDSSARGYAQVMENLKAHVERGVQ
jgi:uncharacterized protein YndB with AHSA1/START domain